MKRAQGSRRMARGADKTPRILLSLRRPGLFAFNICPVPCVMRLFHDTENTEGGCIQR